MSKEKIGTDILGKKPKRKPLELEGDYWEFAKQVKAQKREEQDEDKLPELPPPAGEKPQEKPVHVTEIQAEALAETLKSGKKRRKPFQTAPRRTKSEDRGAFSGRHEFCSGR